MGIVRKAVAGAISKAADLAYRKRIARLGLRAEKNSNALKYWRERAKGSATISGEASMIAFGRLANIELAKKRGKLERRRNALKRLAGRVEGRKA